MSTIEHGGRRYGAGRKPLRADGHYLKFWLSAEEGERLRALAARAGMTIAEYARQELTRRLRPRPGQTARKRMNDTL